jgi:hypothetical protein
MTAAIVRRSLRRSLAAAANAFDFPIESNVGGISLYLLRNFDERCGAAFFGARWCVWASTEDVAPNATRNTTIIRALSILCRCSLRRGRAYGFRHRFVRHYFVRGLP